jgi:hypothetical protein
MPLCKALGEWKLPAATCEINILPLIVTFRFESLGEVSAHPRLVKILLNKPLDEPVN